MEETKPDKMDWKKLELVAESIQSRPYSVPGKKGYYYVKYHFLSPEEPIRGPKGEILLGTSGNDDLIMYCSQDEESDQKLFSYGEYEIAGFKLWFEIYLEDENILEYPYLEVQAIAYKNANGEIFRNYTPTEENDYSFVK